MIPCCSSSNASLLRDLEWESKEDFFIGVHCNIICFDVCGNKATAMGVDAKARDRAKDS